MPNSGSRSNPRRPKGAHARSVAHRVRTRVENGGERLWSLEDFPGLSPSAVARALSRLTEEGLLERRRKGVYYRARGTRFGLSVPTASAVAAQTLRAPVHPAGLTAANVLGFTTQNPGRLEYATSAGAPPTALADAIVHTRRPASREGLSPEDGALLEFLRERASTSDLSPDATVARLRKLLRDRERFARLVRAAADEPPRVRAMLGAAGEQVGADPKLLGRLRKSLNPLSRFEFGRLRSLRYAREWQAK
ncbi:MAG: DUF6088 family protein [Actinomycetota bacterium]